MTLPSTKKLALRAQAQQLKPIVLIGNHGLTSTVKLEIDRALNDHEFIKIRINAETKDERKLITQTICSELQCDLVQSIGHIIAIYRAKLLIKSPKPVVKKKSFNKKR